MLRLLFFLDGLVFIATGCQQPRRQDRCHRVAAPARRHVFSITVFADGRIYFLAEQGVTTVIAPGREFRRLATNTLDGGVLASMAVSGGSLFLRTDTHLYRLVAAEGAEGAER